MGDVYQFLDQDTNLDNPGDWFDLVTSMPGMVPGSNDAAIIQNGQSLTGTLNVNAFELLQSSGQASISLTGASTQITASIGVVAGIGVLDNGAGLTVDSLELVGGGTALMLQNGASVMGNSGDGASITIGTTSGASLLSVSGITTNFVYQSAGGSLLVGDAMSSSATVSVSNGGDLSGIYRDVLIGASDGATATMIISGPGSLAELDTSAEIGDLGQGSLLVEKGGYASLGDGGYTFVGDSDDGTASSGTITATGASSLVSIDGTFSVGSAGVSTGYISVQAGGEIQASNDVYIGNGALTVAGAASIFQGRTLEVSSAGRQPAVNAASGGTVSVVTIHLDAGSIALSGGDVAVRRSGYIAAGTKVSGFGTMSAAAIYNSGVLDASGGTLRFIGPISQTGAAHIEAGATLQLDGSVGSGQTVTFESVTGSIALGDASGFAGLIAGFAQGGTIDLLGVAATKLSFRGTTLTVFNGNAHVAALTFGGHHIGVDFKLGSDGQGGSMITYSNAGAALPALGAPGLPFQHVSFWHTLKG